MEKSINTLEQLNEAFNQLDLSVISGVVHQSAVEGIVIFKSKRTGTGVDCFFWTTKRP